LKPHLNHGEHGDTAELQTMRSELPYRVKMSMRPRLLAVPAVFAVVNCFSWPE